MRLMPFIPEYIPAIGGTDEFIKVPRPDGQPDYLGLKVGSPVTQSRDTAADAVFAAFYHSVADMGPWQAFPHVACVVI